MQGEPGAGRAAAAPDFERLIALQRGGWRRHAVGSVLLVAAGLAVTLGALALAPPSAPPWASPWAAFGLLAAALATLPWREALERRDRADGLEVLREEWEDLDPGDAASRERLLALVEAMFGVPPRRAEPAR